MSDLGTGFSCFNSDGTNDLDPYFRLVSGHRLVIEQVCSQWLQPQGSIVWAPEAGKDLRALLSARVDDFILRAFASAMETVAESDDRVSECKVKIELVSSTKIKVSSSIRLNSKESYDFVLAVEKFRESLVIK